MTELSFANKLYAHLDSGITSGQTTIPIVPGEIGNLWAGFKTGVYLYLTIMNELGQLEIVKVTSLNMNNTITVVRGQGGTMARAYAIGSPVAERFVAEQMNYFLQRGVFPSGDYNPNGVFTGNFNGEKFWQSGPAADQKRWWINAGGGNKWRLMTGDIYGNEYRDAEGFIMAPPPEWSEVAPSEGEYYLFSVKEFGSEIYAVSTYTWAMLQGGCLLKFNGTDAWDIVAPKLGFDDVFPHLTIHGTELFVATEAGNIYKWNGTNAWADVTNPAHTQSLTYSFSFGGNLYAVDYFGVIKKWNGVNGWAAAPAQMPNGIYIGGNGDSVIEIAGKVYAQDNGSAIYEWDGGVAWGEVVTALGWNALNMVNVLGTLYGIDPAGQLFEFDIVGNSSTLIAPAPAGTTIQVIFNFLDEIYGADSTTGGLYKWNGVDAWELAVTAKAAPRSPILAMTSFGLDIYGTTIDGSLYRCTPN